MSLNLDEDLKKNLFRISGPRPSMSPNPEDKKVGNLVILQHPIDGNLIISKNELEEKYRGKIMKVPDQGGGFGGDFFE